MSINFEIEKTSEYIDAIIAIKVKGLPSNSHATIKAVMRDNLGTTWESHATFSTGNAGEIDLTENCPIEGTYNVVDEMGLFWSMNPNSQIPKAQPTPLQPLHTILSVYINETLISETTIERKTIAKHIQKIDVREHGLVGTFFYHDNRKKLPTILVLGGSEGGLRHAQAALLASYGYNTFALAYFGAVHLPKELIEIPLEYIETAINWLKQSPLVDHQHLAVQGISKGGELALLCASRFPVFKTVIALVPSGVVYPGISRTLSGKSSWSNQSEPLPFAYEFVPDKIEHVIKEKREKKEAVAWRDKYQAWANGADECEIAVENSNANILLVSGGDDQLWPSDLLCERVINRLKEKQYTYNVQHLTFKHAGHSIGIPGFPTTTSTVIPGWLELGGTPHANAHAQYQSWAEIKLFLEATL